MATLFSNCLVPDDPTDDYLVMLALTATQIGFTLGTIAAPAFADVVRDHLRLLLRLSTLRRATVDDARANHQTDDDP